MAENKKKSYPMNLTKVKDGVLYWIDKGRHIFMEYFGRSDYEQAVAQYLYDEGIAYFYKDELLLNANEGGINKYGRADYVVTVNPKAPKLNGTYYKSQDGVSWIEDIKRVGETVRHLAIELANYDSTIANLLNEARGGGYTATSQKTANAINTMIKARARGEQESVVVDTEAMEAFNYVETRQTRGDSVTAFTTARTECYNRFKEALGKPIDTDKRSQTNVEEVIDINALSMENKAHIEVLAEAVNAKFIKLTGGTV